MAEIKALYGSNTALNITGLTVLANAASVTSDAVSNLTTNHLDALLYVTVTTGSAAVATGVVEVWIKGSIDNTNFDDDSNDKWIGTILLAAAGTQVRAKTFSVASGFQGTMPPYWKARIKNATGASLTDALATYRGVTGQSV